MGAKFAEIAIPVAAVAFGVATGGLGFGAEAAAGAGAAGAAAGGTAAAGTGITAAEVGTAATLASGAVGAYGAIQSSDAQSKAAKFNAEVAGVNQQIANQNAEFAGAAGEQQAAQQEMKTRAEVGSIKANQAAGGVDVNSGSAVDVRSSAAALGELNAITIRSQAARTAYGYQNQAESYGAQQGLETSQAAAAQTAGAINAGTTALGSLGSASSNWANFQLKSSINPASAANSGITSPNFFAAGDQ